MGSPTPQRAPAGQAQSHGSDHHVKEKACLLSVQVPLLMSFQRHSPLPCSELWDEVAVAQGLGHGQATAVEGIPFAHQLAGQVPPSLPPPVQQGEVVAAPILVPADCWDEKSSSADRVICRQEEVCHLTGKALPHNISQSFNHVCDAVLIKGCRASIMSLAN